MRYRVIHVPSKAFDLFEQLGTKSKFWFDQETRLFKEGREGTGENWAEVVSSRICDLLDIPHAHYDFGIYEEQDGVVTETIVPKGGRLVHGNELLARFSKGYDAEKKHQQSEYTLRTVMALLKVVSDGIYLPSGWDKPGEKIVTCSDLFIGYLMLDALIANQDRHHENWGIIVQDRDSLYLSPTYDHASSLGRNESDMARLERMNTNDKRRNVEFYASRAKSAFYSSVENGKRLKTIEAFLYAAKYSKPAANDWISLLSRINDDSMCSIFNKVPREYITQPAIDFAKRLILVNKHRILKACEGVL